MTIKPILIRFVWENMNSGGKFQENHRTNPVGRTFEIFVALILIVMGIKNMLMKKGNVIKNGRRRYAKNDKFV